jgi:hypothetical protein
MIRYISSDGIDRYASSFSPRSIRAVLGDVTSTTTHGLRATMSDSAAGVQTIATSG